MNWYDIMQWTDDYLHHDRQLATNQLNYFKVQTEQSFDENFGESVTVNHSTWSWVCLQVPKFKFDVRLQCPGRQPASEAQWGWISVTVILPWLGVYYLLEQHLGQVTFHLALRLTPLQVNTQPAGVRHASPPARAAGVQVTVQVGHGLASLQVELGVSLGRRGMRCRCALPGAWLESGSGRPRPAALTVHSFFEWIRQEK